MLCRVSNMDKNLKIVYYIIIIPRIFEGIRMFLSLKSFTARLKAYRNDRRHCNMLYRVFLQTEEGLAGYSVKVKSGKPVSIYIQGGKPPKRVIKMLRTKLYAQNYNLGLWDAVNKRFYATYITYKEEE